MVRNRVTYLRGLVEFTLRKRRRKHFTLLSWDMKAVRVLRLNPSSLIRRSLVLVQLLARVIQRFKVVVQLLLGLFYEGVPVDR